MKFFVLSMIFIGVFLSACNNEPSPGQLVAQGNEAFDEAQYQDAFQSYAEASDLYPDAGEPFYNMGNTLYRQQAYTNTQQLLDQSLARFTGNPESEAQQEWTQATHYNLGNTHFSREDWANAVGAYKDALRLNPDDQAAKYNLELALRRLQEEQEEEQQNQQGGDQDQQNSEDQSQEQNQQGGEQQDQPDQQDAPEEQSQNDQSQGGEEPEQEESQEGESSEDQESGEEQPESQPESEQSSDESSEEGNEDSDASQQQADQEQQPVEGLTMEQARQLVGTVGENAETLQERLQQIYVAPNPPPEKDW